MQATLCQCSPTKSEKWFDDFIGVLRADQIQLETSIASPEKTSLYQVMMSDNVDEIIMLGRQMGSEYFLKKLVFDYVSELINLGRKPNKLAFFHTASRLLVWAEIMDNDELTENNLLLAEAKVNAKYHCYGFHASSTIIEKCDEFEIPSQYQLFLTD